MTQRTATEIRVNPQPTFELSPWLYMQFMEPLGAMDGSINAAWNHQLSDWHVNLVELTQQLAPPLIRWPGGCLTSYYRWREGVGPRQNRPQMLNLNWGGTETNHVGTHEYMDFCERVGAEAMVCVNFEADGRKRWAHPKVLGSGNAFGKNRSAGPREAAEWIDYCNNPSNRERRRNGRREAYNIPLWQIGNETSYDKNGYDVETAARRTRAFALAMRKADPSIRLIGWGDSGWGERMVEVNGDQLDYLAFHLAIRPAWKRSPLRHSEWRKDPDETWRHLMSGVRWVEKKIKRMRRAVKGSDVKLALTECHWVLPGINRCDVQATWAAGVSLAKVQNLFSRHGDVLKIATLADFCGTLWMNNAILIRRGVCYMMPVARVMELLSKHVGNRALSVESGPADLDVTSSRRGSRVFLHVVNLNRTKPVRTRLAVPGMNILSATAFELVQDPMFEVNIDTHKLLAPRERTIPATMTWTFPAASVTAVDLKVEPTAR